MLLLLWLNTLQEKTGKPPALFPGVGGQGFTSR